MKEKEKHISKAFMIIIMFGIISLFGDMVYETARSSNSQYFSLIGISAAKVGLIFGIGEFLGYFLRLISGFFSDKSGKHWIFMFIGYGMLISVPLIGFTEKWDILIVLLLMERIGKALRNPPKDTILSEVAEKEVGVGLAFGISEALDQIGAFLGPLIFTAVFYITCKNGAVQYQTGYKMLFVPYILLMTVLSLAYKRVKKSNILPEIKKEYKSEKLQKIFFVYMAFAFFCALGFVNFSIIGYHLKNHSLMSDGNITLLYSIAMAVDAVAALAIGKIYDNVKSKSEQKSGGLIVLIILPILTVIIPILTLSQSKYLIVGGMAVFGVVMGIHETIMKSAIADVTPFKKRGRGYGIFNTGYGLALMLGSAIFGYFYDINKINIIIAFTAISEIIAIILYYKIYKMGNK